MSNTKFQGSSDDVSLSPGQAKFLYWFVGTAPILKAMTPITTYLGDRWVKLDEEAVKAAKDSAAVKSVKLIQAATRYNNVITDLTRQVTTCSFQLVSYFVAGDIIKAILKKVYASKPSNQQDPGFQQVIMQVVPLSVQVIATIMSRTLGSAQLNKLLKQDAKGKIDLTPASSTWRSKANAFVNQHFREAGTQHLQAGKAAFIGTGFMVAYFAGLVGVLYGISTGLEKAFPGTFKSKHKVTGKNPVPATPALPAPPNLNVESRNGQLPASGTPFNQPASNLAPQHAAIQFSAAHPLMSHSRVAPLGYSR